MKFSKYESSSAKVARKHICSSLSVSIVACLNTNKQTGQQVDQTGRKDAAPRRTLSQRGSADIVDDQLYRAIIIVQVLTQYQLG